jgi:hypothetical protein
VAEPPDHIDSELVRRLGAYADVPLETEQLDQIADGLRQFVELSQSWSDLALAFRFEDGTFSYTQWLMQYRPPWDEPVALNKFRVLGEDGEPRDVG